MEHRHGLHQNLANLKGPVHHVGFDPGPVLVALDLTENVGKDLPQLRNGGGIAVNGHAPASNAAENPQIIKAKDMIGVAVGVEHPIYLLQTGL